MPKKNITPLRLNIYINDPTIRRHVKTAAAKQDVSVSAYCLRAITLQLMRDGEKPNKGGPNFFKAAIEMARRFQTETFGGQVFSVRSSDLIREAREDRDIP